ANISVCSPKYIEVDNNGNLVFLDIKNGLLRKLNLNNSEGGLQRYSPEDPNDSDELIRYADGVFERVHRNGSIDIFNKDGLHIQSIDNLNNATQFVYTDGLLSEIHDPKGGITEIRYNGGLLDYIRDPAN